MSRDYLFRRILIAIPSLLGISLVLFTVLALAPGDPFGELVTNPNVPAEIRLALRAKFGLDDPVLVRYVRWLLAMLQGDWGFSFVSRVNVDTLILQRLPTTLVVIGAAQVLAILVALPVGVLAGTRPYSVFDQVANTLAFIGFSLPTFFTGLLLILLFSVKLDWLPMVYRADLTSTGWQYLWEQLRQSIMPVVVLGLFQGASLVRYVRSAVLDVEHGPLTVTSDELMAVALELLLQVQVVLDDAVVDDDDLAGAVAMWVRVLLGGPAVRRPPGVADTDGPHHWVALKHEREIFELAFAAPHRDVAVRQDGNPGGVVTPVLKLSEALQ